jgi:integrase
MRSGYDLKAEYDNFTKPIDVVIDVDDYELLSLCRRYIADVTSGKVMTRGGSRIKPSTINAYRFVVNTLSQYAATVHRIDLLEYNLSNIQDVQKKRQIATRWGNWFDGLIDYMTKNSFKINSKSTVLQIISCIVNHYAKEFFLMLPPVPRIKTYDNPIVVLPPEFIKKFMNDDKYAKLKGTMRFTWEVCATIMVTSMRISDVISLTSKHFTERADGLFLNKINEKTGALTSMIIPKQLAVVFKENMARYNDIFTPVKTERQTVVYSHICNLFALYEELHETVSASKVNAQGQVEIDSRALYDWVTPHMLRKTAITSMLSNGVSEQHVKFASGHSNKSQAFEKYRGFIERNFQNELNGYYENFT